MSALPRLPGLDGLRGVAVLAVIAYHLNLGNFLPAGFLGVDIFFTVSGFIITALMLQEHARTGRIDFAAFYLRRARRLFPAALFMLLVVVALTPLLQPAALARLREDLPAAFLYVSNWWQIVAQQSYFEAIDQPRLLQHLWSLAVEEQYYLLWPWLCFGLLQRFGKTGLGIAAAGIALASTAWMAWLYAAQTVGTDPSRVYLGTDTHLMGLLTGSAMATVWNPWKIRVAWPARDELLNLAGTAALAALVWVMVETHEGLPGLYLGGFLGAALLTALVIGAATREGTWVAFLLSTRPMRWLGARSYSLYLWHWPVVVWLAPSAQAEAPERVLITVASLLLTVVCAEASYRWIEMRWGQGLAATPWQRRSQAALAVLVALNAWVLMAMPHWALWPPHPPEPTPAPTALGLAASAPATPAKASAALPATPLLGSRRSANTALSGPGDSAPTSTAVPAGKAGSAASPYKRITLIGDSVLLGASPYLLRRLPSAWVEAQVGRQGSDGLHIAQSLRKQTQLGDAIVVHLGTNGYLLESQFRALLQHLSDRKTVVVLNVHGARRWTGPNNALMERVSPEFGNVRLIDWHAIGHDNPSYFVQDGIHLSGSGIHAYYTQIRLALGLPEIKTSSPARKPLTRPQGPAAPKAHAQPDSSAGKGHPPNAVRAEPVSADPAPPTPQMSAPATAPPAAPAPKSPAASDP